MLAESATSSSFGSLRAVGIAVPDGFELVRTARASESAPSGGSQGSNHESVTASHSSWFNDLT